MYWRESSSALSRRASRQDVVVLVVAAHAPGGGVVADGARPAPPDGGDPDVGVPGDELLQHQGEGPRLVVVVEQLVEGVDLVDVLPAPAEGGLHDARAAHVVEVHREVGGPQVAQALRRHVVHVGAVGEDDRLRLHDAELLRGRVAEELVVGGAPEDVVDAVGALQGRHLEVHGVVRHLVAHPVEDDAVRHGLVELGAAELHELRGHSLARRVDLRHERVGEGVLPAPQDADAHAVLRHGAHLVGADSSTRQRPKRSWRAVSEIATTAGCLIFRSAEMA